MLGHIRYYILNDSFLVDCIEFIDLLFPLSGCIEKLNEIGGRLCELNSLGNEYSANMLDKMCLNMFHEKQYDKNTTSSTWIEFFSGFYNSPSQNGRNEKTVSSGTSAFFPAATALPINSNADSPTLSPVSPAPSV